MLHTPEVAPVFCYCGLQNLLYALNCTLVLYYSPFLGCCHPDEVKYESEVGVEKCEIQGENPFGMDVVWGEVTTRDNDQGRDQRGGQECESLPRVEEAGREVTVCQYLSVCHLDYLNGLV